MKYCKVCGASDAETKIYGDLCRKHYLQIKRHGHVLERTIHDPNLFEIEGDVVRISLYDVHGNTVGKALVDYEDLDRVKEYKWYTKHGYVRSKSKDSSKKIFLHRFITEAPEDKFVDHINGDKLDNRKSNLRICTKAENSRHRIRPKRIAGVKKVPSGRFSASITYNYKTIYLGTFDTRDEAVAVRLKAEEQYFKDYRPLY